MRTGVADTGTGDVPSDGDTLCAEALRVERPNELTAEAEGAFKRE